jgi:hypothetical protein
MTNEERDIITQFIERVGGAKPPSGFGSVPGTQPALPPVDRDADALIGDLFSRYPEARYRLTQTAFVQEHALIEAQNRIKRLEWELEQARQQLQAAQSAPQRSSGGGFLSGLFGGGATGRPGVPPQGGLGQPGAPAQWNQGAAPPPPQYPPGYQPPQQMFQRQGSGFLGSALTTAAGVAGGMVAGNALMNLFSGGHGASASELSPAESPWGSPPALPDTASQDGYVDQGTWSNDQGVAQNDPGFADPGTWDSGSDQQASWSDPGGDAGWSDTNNDDTV